MVAHSHAVGGIERHVVNLAHALAHHGHEVAYAGPLDGWLGEQMRQAGHTCLHVPMHGMFDLWSALRLVAFAKRWRADLLHGHAQRGGRYADWAARWSGVPAVMTAHATNAGKWFTHRWPLIAVSGAVRAHLLSRGLPSTQIKVVYPGIPDIDARPPAPGPVSATRPLVLGMVARMERVKGQDLALEALARIPCRAMVRLRLAGADTPWAEDMRRRAVELGVAEQVDFLGQCSDVPALLGELDLLLAPSRRESLGLSLVEAAAAGRSCVAARIGGIPEVVDDDSTGLLVAPEDPDALAGGILRLATDDALRVAWGRAARRRYERLFTLTAMVAQTVPVYQAAVEARARIAA